MALLYAALWKLGLAAKHVAFTIARLRGLADQGTGAPPSRAHALAGEPRPPGRQR
jgi:hypothetical protein